MQLSLLFELFECCISFENFIFSIAASGKPNNLVNDSDTKTTPEVPNGTDAANGVSSSEEATQKDEDKSEDKPSDVEEKEASGKEESAKDPVKDDDGKEDSSNEKATETATMADQANKFLFEFPSPYAHELCTLRQNVVDSFVA